MIRTVIRFPAARLKRARKTEAWLSVRESIRTKVQSRYHDLLFNAKLKRPPVFTITWYSAFHRLGIRHANTTFGRDKAVTTRHGPFSFHSIVVISFIPYSRRHSGVFVPASPFVLFCSCNGGNKKREYCTSRSTSLQAHTFWSQQCQPNTSPFASRSRKQ